MQGIYEIFNLATQCRYIGASSNIKQRWRHHRYELNHGFHDCPPLQNEWVKHGESMFAFRVIETVLDEAMLDERERFWVEQYRVTHPGSLYNIALNADRQRQPRGEKEGGWHHTAAAKAAISKSLHERPRSPETARAISLAKRGKPISEAYHNALMGRRKGQGLSDEWREALRRGHATSYPSQEVQDDIRRRFADGESLNNLVRTSGVSIYRVRKIVQRRE